MARRSKQTDPFNLKQKVNFYLSVSLIASFGFLMTLTVVQAADKDALLVQNIASPISVEM